MAKSKAFSGKKIREVWDFRLSYAHPILYNSGDFWVIHIYANNPHHEAWKDHPGLQVTKVKDPKTGKVSENISVLLEEIKTEIPTCPNGDPKERMTTEAIESGQRQCYPILYGVRDKYSRDNIGLRKPVVAMINSANAHCDKLNTEAMEAAKNGDNDLAVKKGGEMRAFIEQANADISKAVKAMKREIAAGDAS